MARSSSSKPTAVAHPTSISRSFGWDGARTRSIGEPVVTAAALGGGRHAALFKWRRHEAAKSGYGTKRTLFLADGAEAIWDQQAFWFPKAGPCIDWVHIVEKLWAAGRCLHREGSDQLAAWVRGRVRELRSRSGADKVSTALSAAYASIAKTGPGNKAKREKLLDVLTHIGKHRHRMRYHALRFVTGREATLSEPPLDQRVGLPAPIEREDPHDPREHLARDRILAADRDFPCLGPHVAPAPDLVANRAIGLVVVDADTSSGGRYRKS